MKTLESRLASEINKISRKLTFKKRKKDQVIAAINLFLIRFNKIWTYFQRKSFYPAQYKFNEILEKLLDKEGEKWLVYFQTGQTYSALDKIPEIKKKDTAYLNRLSEKTRQEILLELLLLIF